MIMGNEGGFDVAAEHDASRTRPGQRRHVQTAVARKLAATDPSNVEWQRDVSVSLERVGDVRRAAGDRAGALG